MDYKGQYKTNLALAIKIDTYCCLVNFKGEIVASFDIDNINFFQEGNKRKMPKTQGNE